MIAFRSNARIASTVSGMIFSVAPDRWKPPITPCSGRPGKHSRACVRTFTTPACEHAVSTTTPLSFTLTATKRSSVMSGSGSQPVPSSVRR